MDGRQLYVIMSEVPNDPNYKDSVSGEHIYLLFDEEPWLYVEKRGNKWVYSERTINSIASEFNKTYPFHLNEIKDYLPDFMMESYLGLQLWQWLGMVLYIITGILLYYILFWIFGYFLIKIFKKHKKQFVFFQKYGGSPCIFDCFLNIF